MITTAKRLDEPKHSMERELKRLYRDGKISYEEYKERMKSVSGWFDCSKCNWSGAFAPIDFSNGENRVYCPVCESMFE